MTVIYPPIYEQVALSSIELLWSGSMATSGSAAYSGSAGVAVVASSYIETLCKLDPGAVPAFVINQYVEILVNPNGIAESNPPSPPTGTETYGYAYVT